MTPCYGIGSVHAASEVEAWPLLVDRAVKFRSDQAPYIVEQQDYEAEQDVEG